MVERITWPQALAWRMQRHLLEPVGTRSVAEVVRRLGAVQAQVATAVELAVRVRRLQSSPGEVARAATYGSSPASIIRLKAARSASHICRYLCEIIGPRNRIPPLS